jgi:FMN phosphatase YigB (HAD superfamily)
MKYILDFDRTVFDMDALYTQIAKINPDTKLGTIESLDKIDIARFIFPDALAFVAAHQSSDIYIVSSCYGKSATWDIEYQREKIKRSKIALQVNRVYVVSTSKIAVLKSLTTDMTKAIYVDDHLGHVQAAADALPDLQTVYLDRAGATPAPAGIPRITSLAEINTVTK